MLTQEFIIKTDTKSLRTQVRKLVERAQKIARNQLDTRRAKLKALLDTEDWHYEREFAAKVKTRIEEHIKDRKEVLFRLRENNAKIEEDFLEQKRAQYLLENCHELRDTLRNHDAIHMRAVQRQQIAEKKLALEKEKEINRKILEVHHETAKKVAECKEHEEEHKHLLECNLREIWDVQIAHKNQQKQLQKQEKMKENAEMKRIFHESNDEKFKSQPCKDTQYRHDLLKMIAERAEQRRMEKENKLAEEREMQLQLNKLDEQEKLMSIANKRKADTCRKEFINYSKRVREIKELISQKESEDLHNLEHILFNKKPKFLSVEKHSSENAKHFSILNQQREEKRKRNADEETERREKGNYVNPFLSTSENESRKQRENLLEHNKQLELQISEIRSQKMRKAKSQTEIFSVTEPTSCQKDAYKYRTTYNKYLPVHPLWKHLEAFSDIGAGDGP